MAIIFDGYAAAAQKETQLKTKVADLTAVGKKLVIASVLFTEDQGSLLYTQFKKDAAQRVGIEYQINQFSLRDSIELVSSKIDQLNSNPQVTGIIIQKPWRQTWQDVTGQITAEFHQWWNSLVAKIEPAKDVDGLHPHTLTAIKNGNWEQQKKVLPATCAAVLEILEVAPVPAKAKYIILGKSDLLGQPLFFYLQNLGMEVEMIGSSDLVQRLKDGVALYDADVIVSATGKHNLITADLIKPNVVVIDVGEPQSDVDLHSVAQKAAFVTPVPGGVGPMTVVSLLENCLKLAELY